MLLGHIRYESLNARQKENYSHHKFNVALADYGFVTVGLSDDRADADFIAQHVDATSSAYNSMAGWLSARSTRVTEGGSCLGRCRVH